MHAEFWSKGLIWRGCLEDPGNIGALY